MDRSPDVLQLGSEGVVCGQLLCPSISSLPQRGIPISPPEFVPHHVFNVFEIQIRCHCATRKSRISRYLILGSKKKACTADFVNVSYLLHCLSVIALEETDSILVPRSTMYTPQMLLLHRWLICFSSTC